MEGKVARVKEKMLAPRWKLLCAEQELNFKKAFLKENLGKPFILNAILYSFEFNVKSYCVLISSVHLFP